MSIRLRRPAWPRFLASPHRERGRGPARLQDAPRPRIASSSILRRLAGTAAAILAIAGISWVDYVTGRDVTLSLFYLLPVIASGWWFGPIPAAIVAVLAGAASFLAEFLLAPELPLFVSAWNGSTRLLIFFFVGVMMSRLRIDREQLRSLNKRLTELLEHEANLARTDLLTSLPNSRAFLDTLRAEVQRSRRGGHPLCVAYLDLDNFKQINDLCGHAAGDALLQRVATVIRNTIRTNDIAARLAGDEFAIVFWDIRPDGLEKTVQRLIDRIAELGHDYRGASLGASVGVAQFQNPPDDVDEILRRADSLMYKAKAAGKGRLVCWSQSTEESTVTPEPSIEG